MTRLREQDALDRWAAERPDDVAYRRLPSGQAMRWRALAC